MRSANFGRGGRPETGAVFQGRFEGRSDIRGIVAVNCGAPRTHKIDQPVALDRKQVRTVGAFGEKRRAADGAECPDRGIDATRNQFERPGK